MKAIILAAGRGERMRPLTDHCPKPLLRVHGKPLIEWHLEALAKSGVREVVVNTAWLEEQIVAALGDGSRWGLAIRYSLEGREHGGALETAGGLKTAWPLLGDAEAFWYVAADVYAPGFAFDAAALHGGAASHRLAHLWLVENPPQHPDGDFGIADGLATAGRDGERYTWSGIGAFSRTFVTGLLHDLPPGRAARLRPYLDAAIVQRRIGAEPYGGTWADIGTPQRLDAVNAAGA